MKVTIIGAGNMGGAIARGLAAQALSISLTVANRSRRKLEAIATLFPDVITTTSNIDAARDADVVILAVKPWLIDGVAREIAPAVKASGAVVVSVAAGVSLEALAAALDDTAGTVPLAAVIPNTAVAMAEGMTFACLNAAAAALSPNPVIDLFSLLGKVMVVDSEAMMMPLMKLSSCGIAYVLRFISAMTRGGVTIGIPEPTARRVVLQTLLGAVSLLDGVDTHPEAEIDKVTTPGGFTIKGLNAMERHGFTPAVIAALTPENEK